MAGKSNHTNGAFWQAITTWLHANESRSWNESDLKQAIKGRMRAYNRSEPESVDQDIRQSHDARRPQLRK